MSITVLDITETNMFLFDSSFLLFVGFNRACNSFFTIFTQEDFLLGAANFSDLTKNAKDSSVLDWVVSKVKEERFLFSMTVLLQGLFLINCLAFHLSCLRTASVARG